MNHAHAQRQHVSHHGAQQDGGHLDHALAHQVEEEDGGQGYKGHNPVVQLAIGGGTGIAGHVF